MTSKRSNLRVGKRIARFAPATALALALAGWMALEPARAVVIELKDVASDRVERQRAEAIGLLPLPGTPSVSQLAERLAEKKMTLGSPILIRVFKASSELELWMQSGDKFELFATYPICNWSGTLGPKLTEGDKQSPEGVYTVSSSQLHLVGRHPRSLNLGFPNALDRQMSRTGSYILIHGACSSVGCFAMTNPVIEEVYSLAEAALNKGRQDAVQVQVYPFRMTEERLNAYTQNEWYPFWRNLKDISDSFERTHLPPRITICEGRYWVEDGTLPQEVASQGPLAVCAVSLAEAASANGRDDAGRSLQRRWWPLTPMVPPALVSSRPSAPMVRSPTDSLTRARSSPPSSAFPSPRQLMTSADGRLEPASTTTTTASRARFAASGALRANVRSSSASPCSTWRTSCRHWLASPANRAMAAAALAKTRTAADPGGAARKRTLPYRPRSQPLI